MEKYNECADPVIPELGIAKRINNGEPVLR